jgi:predicted amidohydrolase YtcJ
MSADEPSKRAHVTTPAVLSADYFTMAEQDISRIESMLTVVGGKIVYAGAAARLAGTSRGAEPER